MEDQPTIITRRDLLRSAGMVGATAVAAPASLLSAQVAADPAQAGPSPARLMAHEAFENLTATEADLLEAVVDRLVPSDAIGPGAKEARAAHYIDRALGGALASSRPAYGAGLGSLDRYAQTSRGTGFLELSARDKDAVLVDCETGNATGFAGGSGAFFTLVLTHTRQGMFGDPYYGGNANFIGWDLIGYPGIRTMVTPADQRALESGQMKANHKSAYDYDGFNKATAMRHDGPTGDRAHGD